MDNEKSSSHRLIYHPLVDRLLPENQRIIGGLEEMRARVLVLSAVVVAIWGPIFAALYFFQGQRLLAASYLLTVTAAGPVLYLCLKHRTAQLAGAMLALILYALLIALITTTGGVESNAIKWLTLVPPIAYIFGARRAFFALIVLVLVSMGFYAIAPAWGIELPMVITPQQNRINHLIGLVALTLILPQLFVLNSGLQQWLAERVRREETEKRKIEAELRRVQEEALVRSQQGLESLIERSPDGILVLREGRVVAANPAFRKMMRYEGRQSLVGSPAISLVSDDERGEFRELLSEIGADKDVAYRDFFFLRADGETVVAEVTGMIGAYESKKVCFCLVRDVTERKKVQGKMMQIDRMNAVGTLAAGVAHEINNPLAYVHSNTEYLLTLTSKYRKKTGTGGAADVLSHEEVAEALEDIREGTDRIRSIVSDLGTFSKPEQQSTRPLDVVEVLGSTLKMAENQLRHRARLITDFEEVPAVQASEANLAQVFLNLLVNAAQAIPEGAVEANEVEVATYFDRTCDRVVVETRDTGPGIPEEVQARIFDPFFSTKGQDEGMGLGLFICRNIVRDHGGDISFESTPGVGTTFRVELPAVEKKAEPSREFQSPIVKGGVIGRALIIDDEDGVCRTIERVLSRSYKTISVNSGREALEMLERDPSFAVVICDLLMPDISGVEVYEHVSRHYPRLQERMVFVTGGTFTERTNEFVTSTARPVILKPFNIKEFREIVDATAQA